MGEHQKVLLFCFTNLRRCAGFFYLPLPLPANFLNYHAASGFSRATDPRLITI